MANRLRGTGRMLFFLLFQISAILIVATHLGRSRTAARRTGEQSWDSLLARLRSDWSARHLTDRYLKVEGLDATPEETWRRVRGPYGLWAMYQNARVMLDMADFAARSNHSVDRELLEALRSDAMQIRVWVVVALAQYAFSQVNESIRVNTFRAASIYVGMAARMTQLLKNNAAWILPEFEAAI